ncbi:2,3,4,5-tetrahydropyridine-2,6-dicarboxylate N-acetyltransferase [Lacticaseibacillus paracasei]|uniref:2,3,4,5-tetrahydropyridine-2,6-dicarboxylate N-acetyltransferase n=1 Tax=Lacticaseibacillus paracasei TaxID=1597 RepID=UPI00237F091B|nr:2,3,4,5-tetrahydropyridine-2,6-dicarboxylate N-acetyltransferase [Lacticaseibacillus paracasei]MDE3303436.1 2,3,4,5-tetrahydropyridine-2,6-dicarboxylate N-acetyltransferase [Lacticaseibacillus paracasei]
MAQLDTQKIISTIANSKKTTPVKVYLKGKLSELHFPKSVHAFIGKHTGTVIGDWAEIKPILKKAKLDDYYVETAGRNTGVPLLDIKAANARIEPGAIIRDQVLIGDNAVIMMGAIINIGAEIGAGTMIDMGAVLGGRAIVGKHCHIGASTVLAGVVEPPSTKPVTIGDHVMIGANAVVLEGTTVGEGAVIAAGAVVINDVPAHTVVAGVPAKVIKQVNDQTEAKTVLLDELRKL